MRVLLTAMLLMCFAFAKAELSPLQSYTQHTVAQGETIYFITNKYKISAAELMRLNPDLKAGLKTGSTLVVPASTAAITTARIVDYDKHRVRRKETLYSIAKEYGVTVLDIKDANRTLYSTELRRGDRIRIPIFDKNVKPLVEIVENEPQELKPGQYRVLKSEGKYRVAKKHNLTIVELDELNPGVDELKEGMIINVANRPLTLSDAEDVESAELSYVMYTVPPKMNMYRLTRMTGLSQDSLVAINPALKDGVRNGMEIKIPYQEDLVDGKPIITTQGKTARLVDSLRNYQDQRVAVMLPFSISSVDADGFATTLEKDKTSRIATDFYSGMMIARDSARALGITVDFDVYDTQRNTDIAVRIVRENNFDRYNYVVGPLLANPVVAVARELKSDDIPVISPLTNTDVRLYKNLFQARPDEESLMNNLKMYLQSFAAGKKVIVIADNELPQLKDTFVGMFPDATVIYPDDKNYISSAKYASSLDKEMANVVLLASRSSTSITSAISAYAARSRTHDLTVIGVDDFDNMNLNNMSLAAVNYTYPQINRDTGSENIFATHYFNKHGITPNEFATRGFDVTMDLILRQASADDLYDSVMRNGKTIMVENSFNYSKKFMSGYYNEASYILRYQPDLSIEQINIYE
ncbi:LysM peptidoglycan-binding domain-containing protein [Nonlabens ponticola]|uniref:LysM peptidoglycan-binding domain-containing protein n=1 Tax=Nonlabens ponticola TaxID=2496866 RepID=A0A3S9MZP1_9FLAO|nr:LysM peptidoglycan-binding domain-containing protein [Nonlabens ponticola]AZQ44736.1 LysM peptidoglycan-binding domain-containing protein [Nonlabens ponticola]